MEVRVVDGEVGVADGAVRVVDGAVRVADGEVGVVDGAVGVVDGAVRVVDDERRAEEASVRVEDAAGDAERVLVRAGDVLRELCITRTPLSTARAKVVRAHAFPGKPAVWRSASIAGGRHHLAK